MARARNHIHVLEENMALLMEQAIANEGLFYRLLYLQRSLTAASNSTICSCAFTAGRAISAWQVRVCACFRIAGA